MSICPKCKEEIDRLKLKIVKHSVVYFDGKDFEEDEYLYPSDTDEEWVCPECDEVLEIEDDGEATEFLENDELKKIVSEKLKRDKKENADMPKL